MNSKIKKIISVVSAFCMIGNAAYFNSSQFSASAASKCIVENLDRGISAVNTGSGMMISWRFLAGDSDSVVFKLYRNNTLIYTSNAGQATCFLDKSGKSTDKYKNLFS